MSQAVNLEVTRKIAKLARLKLSEEELTQYTKELGKVMDFIEQLSGVGTDGVEPLLHGIELDPHFREDEAIALTEAETHKIVACSEQSLYEQYKVPQVIGGES